MGYSHKFSFFFLLNSNWILPVYSKFASYIFLVNWTEFGTVFKWENIREWPFSPGGGVVKYTGVHDIKTQIPMNFRGLASGYLTISFLRNAIQITWIMLLAVLVITCVSALFYKLIIAFLLYLIWVMSTRITGEQRSEWSLINILRHPYNLSITLLIVNMLF